MATSTRSKGVFQRDTLADLAELIGFAHWLGYACVGLVLALVATTTVMAVQDRIKEHAVLQTLGLRPGRIFRLVIAESVLQSLAGGLLGIGAGLALLAWGGFAVGAEGVTIAFKPSLELAMTGAIGFGSRRRAGRNHPRLAGCQDRNRFGPAVWVRSWSKAESACRQIFLKTDSIAYTRSRTGDRTRARRLRCDSHYWQRDAVWRLAGCQSFGIPRATAATAARRCQGSPTPPVATLPAAVQQPPPLHRSACAAR